MQAENELFNCVEIMLFGVPLICHMTWYNKKAPYCFYALSPWQLIFLQQTMIRKMTFLIPKPPQILQISFHELEVV